MPCSKLFMCIDSFYNTSRQKNSLYRVTQLRHTLQHATSHTAKSGRARFEARECDSIVFNFNCCTTQPLKKWEVFYNMILCNNLTLTAWASFYSSTSFVMATQYSILWRTHNLIHSFPPGRCSGCTTPFVLTNNNGKTILGPNICTLVRAANKACILYFPYNSDICVYRWCSGGTVEEQSRVCSDYWWWGYPEPFTHLYPYSIVPGTMFGRRLAEE